MYYVDKRIKDIYRVKPRESRESFLRLDTNEDPEGLPSDFIYSVINKITPEFLAMYPEKVNLINLLSSQNDISQDSISVTNGSDEAIRLVYETFCQSGKKVISATPTFEMYRVYSNMFGMIHEEVMYDQNFQIDILDIIQMIDKDTNLIILLNPNSPIGTTYDEEEVRMIIEKAEEMEAIVLIDEAYHYFYEKSFLHLIKEYDNILVTRTFSKLCALAGARIGYVAGSKELINYIENAQSTYNVNSIAILLAEELLKRPDIIQEQKEKEKIGREYLIRKLKETGYIYYCNQGNFILIKCILTPNIVAAELKKKKILVKTYKAGILKDWLRVTTGGKIYMEQFWKMLQEIDHA